MNSLLDKTRYQYGWGVGCFGNWGAADERPHYLHSSTHHVQAALRRLLAQYADKPNMIALVTALCAPCQDLEDAGQAVLQLRSLDTGFGASLDGIGDLLVLQRGGIVDNTYRIRLAATAIAANCSGTPEEIRGILDFLMRGLNPVRLIEEPPATTVLRTYELPQLDGDVFAMITRRGAPVGTRIIIQWELPSYTGPSFGFEDDNSTEPFAEWGADPSPAGLWAEGWDGRTRS